MEYMFTYMRRGNYEVPIVRVYSEDPEEIELDIGKHHTVVIEQIDMTITYDFVITNPIKSEQVGELYYKWYQLDYYSKNVDRTVAIKPDIDQNKANIDYIAMMSGIDIPDGVDV